MKHKPVYLALFLFLTACGNQQQDDTKTAVKDSVTTVAPASVARERTIVSKEPAAQYSEKVPDELNDWKFAVKLYETKNTFTYTVKIEYQELRETETINFPDFGMMPEPQVIKGKEPLSCIIGFLDKNKIFKEYILVQAKGDRLKMTTLQHYSVYKSETKL